MNGVMILGFLAGTLTTISFIPQLIKAWRTKSTGDISITMYIAFTIGVMTWMVYGIMISALPIILTNAVTLATALMILALKIRYR